jgi:capsular polysaccharide biosynthesis protein
VDFVTILRELWQRRALVAVVAIVAAVVGYLLAFQASFPPKSRSYTVGVASARILVDTPRSQVVDVAPKGSEMLGARASVLANLMVEGDIKKGIAQRARLRPGQLHAMARSADGEMAAPDSWSDPKAHVLTTSVLMNSDLVELPIIRVEAQAPDPARATTLANAAVGALSDYLDSKAAAEQVSDGRRLRVRGLGAAQASVAARGPGRMVALAAAIFIFVLGCAAIVGVTALARAWRKEAAVERSGSGAVGPGDSAEAGLAGDGWLKLLEPDEDADDPARDRGVSAGARSA